MMGDVSVTLIASEWTFPGGDADCSRVDILPGGRLPTLSGPGLHCLGRHTV
jgi:hypothetical protein